MFRIKHFWFCLAFAFLFSSEFVYCAEKSSEQETNGGVGEVWHSFTLDNDLFVGDDSGYTNGLYYSRYEVIDYPSFSSDFLLKPLLAVIDLENTEVLMESNTFGQSMITPQNIEMEFPDPQDIPYSGFLFYNTSLLAIEEEVADKISTTIGIVGPSSGAEVMQEFFHKVLGSDEPLGWEHQLHDEIVFQFSRGRAWRSWVSDNQFFDFVTSAEASVGTISTDLSGSFLLRLGKNMERSFPAALLTSARATNPVAVDGGWFFYAGLEASYIHNFIFLDGNTFVDSPSIKYDPVEVSAMFGFAYSWDNFSITLAINDLNILGFNDRSDITELTRYGTLTFIWRG